MVSRAQVRDGELLVNGLRFHYREWGSPGSPQVFLLHGGGQSAHLWNFLAASLADRYHLFALDQRGHGDSDWAPHKDYTPESFLADHQGVVRQLGINQRPFLLMGLSLGGLNALRYAASHPDEVRALVVVDVGPEPDPEGVQGIIDFYRGAGELEFEELIDYCLRFNPRRTRDQLRASLPFAARPHPNGKWAWKMDVAMLEDAQQTSLQHAHLWASVSQIRCPTALIIGGESAVLHQENSQRIVDRLKDGRLKVVPGASHSVPGDNPAGFEAAVREFLAEIGDGEGTSPRGPLPARGEGAAG